MHTRALFTAAAAAALCFAARGGAAHDAAIAGVNERREFIGSFTPTFGSPSTSGNTSGSGSGRGARINVSPEVSWGVWDGWGTSLCWWANVLGARDDLADLVFTTNNVTLHGQGRPIPGLGMNIARYNAGGSGWRKYDGAAMVASKNEPGWKQIAGFWEDGSSADPSSPSWNWTADANQVAMLQKAQKRGANILELFSNSPMWWQCSNHNPSGNDDGSKDNLEARNHLAHASYLAEVTAHAAKQWGVTFQSVEAFNEPIASWWKSTGTQEGCHFGHSTQGALVSLLRQALDRRNLTSVLVAASDENTYDMALSTWKAFDAKARNVVGQVNVHGYQQGDGRRDLLYAAVHSQGKTLWNSEYGEGDASGKSLASNLNLDFKWLHNTAWVYWQVFDQGGWGLVESDVGAGEVGAPNNKYFVLAHYSRHIRPGYTIIDNDDSNTVTAFSPADQKLVIVTANYGGETSATFSLSKFKQAAGPALRWTTRLDGQAGGEQYRVGPPLHVLGATLTVPLQASSIVTLEVAGVVA